MKSLRPSYFTAGCWIGFGLWMAAICVLSSMSGPKLEPAFQFIPGDKVAHFVAFMPGGALFTLALLRSFPGLTRLRAALLAVLGLGIFAALDEWHQTFTPQRSGADLGDWTADILGAVTGMAITCLRYGKNRRQRED